MPQFNLVCQQLQTGFRCKGEVYRQVPTGHEKDQIKVIARILQSLVPQTDYCIELDDSQGEPVRFTDTVYRSALLKYLGKLFPAVAHGVNCLLTCTQSYHLQVSCLRLLYRVYHVL